MHRPGQLSGHCRQAAAPPRLNGLLGPPLRLVQQGREIQKQLGRWKLGGRTMREPEIETVHRWLGEGITAGVWTCWAKLTRKKKDHQAQKKVNTSNWGLAYPTEPQRQEVHMERPLPKHWRKVSLFTKTPLNQRHTATQTLGDTEISSALFQLPEPARKAEEEGEPVCPSSHVVESSTLLLFLIYGMESFVLHLFVGNYISICGWLSIRDSWHSFLIYWYLLLVLW